MKNRTLLFVFAMSTLMAVSCKKETVADVAVVTDTTSTTTKNIAIVKESTEASLKNDSKAIYKNYADSYTEYGDGSGAPQVYKDKDSLAAGQKMMMAAFPDYKVENAKYYADGDEVIVIADWGGTWKNDLMGQKATGKAFKFKDAEIYTVKDGKITSHRTIAQMKPIAESVGFVWPEDKK